jgi:hypothetical protein
MKNYALITGASGGIGWELAKLFAVNAHNLILVARNNDKLQELKTELIKTHAIDVVVISKDLSKQNAAIELYADIKKLNIQVDFLINNAGFGDYGFYPNTNFDKENQMLQLNIVSLTQLTKLFLPDMIKNKSGKILNVASVAGFMPGAFMTVYYASKAFVLSYTEGLAEELKGTGVSVTALCPGPTKTAFEENAALGESKLFKTMPVASAKDVAKYGYKAMMCNQTVAVQGIFNKLTVFSASIFPRIWVRKMVKMLQKP